MSRHLLAAVFVSGLLAAPGLNDAARSQLFDLLLKMLEGMGGTPDPNEPAATTQTGFPMSATEPEDLTRMAQMLLERAESVRIERQARDLLRTLHEAVDRSAFANPSPIHAGLDRLFGETLGTNPKYDLRREMYFDAIDALAKAEQRPPRPTIAIQTMNGDMHVHIGDVFIQHASAFARATRPLVAQLNPGTREGVQEAFDNLEREAAAQNPRPDFIRDCLDSAKRVLEAAGGELIAGMLKELVRLAMLT